MWIRVRRLGAHCSVCGSVLGAPCSHNGSVPSALRRNPSKRATWLRKPHPAPSRGDGQGVATHRQHCRLSSICFVSLDFDKYNQKHKQNNSYCETSWLVSHRTQDPVGGMGKGWQGNTALDSIAISAFVVILVKFDKYTNTLSE